MVTSRAARLRMEGGDLRGGIGASGEERRAHLVEAGAGFEEAARLQRQAGERAEVYHRGGMRERSRAPASSATAACAPAPW